MTVTAHHRRLLDPLELLAKIIHHLVVLFDLLADVFGLEGQPLQLPRPLLQLLVQVVELLAEEYPHGHSAPGKDRQAEQYGELGALEGRAHRLLPSVRRDWRCTVIWRRISSAMA